MVADLTYPMHRYYQSLPSWCSNSRNCTIQSIARWGNNVYSSAAVDALFVGWMCGPVTLRRILTNVAEWAAFALLTTYSNRPLGLREFGPIWSDEACVFLPPNQRLLSHCILHLSWSSADLKPRRGGYGRVLERFETWPDRKVSAAVWWLRGHLWQGFERTCDLVLAQDHAAYVITHQHSTFEKNLSVSSVLLNL